MSMFNFSNSIPARNNNPSNDQPLMLQNNIANAAIWDVDHVGFNANDGGEHLQVTFNTTTSQTTPGDPTSILFTVQDSTTANHPQLQFLNSNNAGQYSSDVTGVGFDSVGSTVLLGGIIMKFGHITPGVNSGTVSFTNSGGTVNLNIGAFPNHIFTIIGQTDDMSSQPNTFIYLKSPTQSKFDFKGVLRTSTPSSAVTNFWFIALGN